MRRVVFPRAAAAVVATFSASAASLSCRIHLQQPTEQRRMSSSRHAPSTGGASFKAPPNVGPGRPTSGGQANPYKSWEHMNHKWLILMCLGCLAGGLMAGQVAEVDETKLQPKFIKEDVINDALKQFEFRPDLAATAVRVAFVLAARRAGFAAESVDESCATVQGLEDIAGVFNYLATKHNGTMEDIASLASLAALKFLRAPCEEITWRWGRNDSDEAPPRKQPVDPSVKFFSLPAILHSLGDLTDAECVALMACHGVGEFHENVSGVGDVSHTGGTRYTIDNKYYTFLLRHEKAFKPFEVPRTEENKGIRKLPQDFVSTTAVSVKDKKKKKQCVINQREVNTLLRKKEWRVWVEMFSADEALWRVHFQSAFSKMIDSNFKRLRVYGTASENVPTVENNADSSSAVSTSPA